VNGQASLLAEGQPWWPPSVKDFYLPGWLYPWVTKFTGMVGIAIVLVLVFYLVAYRKPTLVPGRMQWLAESVYSFTR
jgi:F-type H+-transporting ATPase subunit a